MKTILLPEDGRLEVLPLPPSPMGIVLIIPGGGYAFLSPREEMPVANAFMNRGWGAAILYYTCHERADQPPLGNVPMRQASNAIHELRVLYPDLMIALCGFSAGGHLAASVGVHWQRLGLEKPDRLILCYPVISSGVYAHKGSFDCLCGSGDREFFSLEKQTGPWVPPTFLWATMTDGEVPVANTIMFAQALHRDGVPVEVHLFPKGPHGLSVCTHEVDQPEKGRLADPHVAGWVKLAAEWLETAL